MPKFTFSFLPTLVIAVLCLPAIGAAQTDPGSLGLDSLLGADFDPLQEQNAQSSTDLHAPLVIVPPVPNAPVAQSSGVIPPPTVLDVPRIAIDEPAPGELALPDLPPLQEQNAQRSTDLHAPLVIVPPVPNALIPQSSEVIPPPLVLDVPRIAIDEPAPGELVLPDLTIPTPENTTVDPLENRRSLKPQFEVQRQVQIEPAIPQPRLQSPQALNYGNSYSSRSRLQIVPLQVEVFSVNRGYGYQPYGGYSGYRPGYRSSYRSGYGSSYRSGYGSSYRPGSYGGYGGGSRYCPYGR